MNVFESLKEELKRKYPPLKTLPWSDRLQARFVGTKWETSIEVENKTGLFRQSAVILSYKGKDYLFGFGRLSS